MTGLSQIQISHYISGKDRSTLDIIRRIADGVDMPCPAAELTPRHPPTGSAWPASDSNT